MTYTWSTGTNVLEPYGFLACSCETSCNFNHRLCKMSEFLPLSWHIHDKKGSNTARPTNTHEQFSAIDKRYSALYTNSGEYSQHVIHIKWSWRWIGPKAVLLHATFCKHMSTRNNSNTVFTAQRHFASCLQFFWFRFHKITKAECNSSQSHKLISQSTLQQCASTQINTLAGIPHPADLQGQWRISKSRRWWSMPTKRNE